MMNGDWMLASKCPHCGGRMTVSVFYSYSRDYIIGRNGQPNMRSKKSCDGPMDAYVVRCNWCNSTWDEEDTNITERGIFIRWKGCRGTR